MPLSLCAPIFAIILIAASSPAQAQQYIRRHAHTMTTTTTTTHDHDDVADDDSDSVYVDDLEPIDRIVEETFGSRSGSGMTGCKTEDRANDTIKGLKSDCNAWIKDRKAELKDKFVTASCKEKCDDCGMSMQRCAVTGIVHYTLRK